MTKADTGRAGPGLHWKILAGLIAGLVVGIALNLAWGATAWSALGVDDSRAWLEGAQGGNPRAGLSAGLVRFVVNLNGFTGDIFMRALRFIAVPIVLFSLIVGASSLNDLRKLSRIGGKTIATYLLTTALAISIGLLLANAVSPGSSRFISPETRDRLAGDMSPELDVRFGAAEGVSGWKTLVNLVPQNPFRALADGDMLQIVVFALAVGICLTLIPREKAAPIVRFFDGMTDVVIKLVTLIMYCAPIAVFALISRVVSSLGLDVLGALLAYSLVVVTGLALMVFAVYPAILRAFTSMPYGRFLKGIAPAQILAFSSSSSGATLPVTMKCAEENLGVPEEVSSFVLPIGATVNMDGTALYQGVATVFIAQMFDIGLSLTQMLTIVLTATLASIGTAAVPGVGIVMLIIVLQAVNMPPEVMTTGVAVILGVDRILDMCRTTCNITGDAMVATLVAGTEGTLKSADILESEKSARSIHGIDEHPPEPGADQYS
jgi:Na+/H+-dicarboxylate symporter